ncbi:hypothetical protein [Reyranella soli]|uniref:Uncharacterized protein n=1 Tax=Reyranella soli TaxID=1230389 RepID=A0A512N7L0_9HYPH|nr:hypothetical protein [Reyranella soli]GEP54661.1 hypothetical protein RSO01_18270 [Reyranella soli]
MGARAALTGGHLCIDLTNIEMTGAQQQELLQAVQATVVKHLARQFASAKVITISMAPNNGFRPQDEPDQRPDPNRPTEPERPRPDPEPKPDPAPKPQSRRRA